MQAGQLASIQAAEARRLRRLACQKSIAAMASTAAAARAGPLARSKARAASGPRSRPKTRWA